MLSPGAAILIGSKDSSSVYAASSLLDFDDFIKFGKANDRDGINEMILAGSLLVLQHGTKALLIEEGSRAEHHYSEVRIKSGKYAGSRLFVLRSHVL
jgi:hypothetical protein